jgi:hypothetical protein
MVQPHKPSLKELVLASRIGKSDWEAAEELWPLLIDAPFDDTRPGQDVIKEIADAIKDVWIIEEEPVKPASTSEALTAAIEATQVFVDLAIKDGKIKKSSGGA